MSCNHLFRVLLVGLLLGGLSLARAASDPNVEYHYNVNVELFSIQDGPQGPIKDSYCFQGSGSAEAGSSLGLYCGDLADKDSPRSWVDIKPFEENGKFFVDVEIRPDSKTSSMKPRKERLAMSNLKPVSLDLVRDEKEKRSFNLNLTPSIKRIDRTKRPIEASTLNLDRWTFEQSDVIVDQWRYAGQFHASGMNIVFMDIPGYARIEFSLQPFRDAQPLGSMQDGHLTIQKPGGSNPQVVWIRNVKIGSPAMTIPGGPYMVWVRWLPPSQTITQAAQRLANFDLAGSLAGGNLDEATKKQMLAQQQALKEKIGKLKEADFAPEGVIPQVLGGMHLISGIQMQSGGMIIPAQNKK